VSFATDAIYPLLPFLLTQVFGAGVVSLGVVEALWSYSPSSGANARALHPCPDPHTMPPGRSRHA